MTHLSTWLQIAAWGTSKEIHQISYEQRGWWKIEYFIHFQENIMKYFFIHNLWYSVSLYKTILSTSGSCERDESVPAWSKNKK